MSLLLTLNNKEIIKNAVNLCECYPDGLEESVSSEFAQFVSIVKEIIKTNPLEKEVSLELKLYRFLHKFAMVGMLFKHGNFIKNIPLYVCHKLYQ